MSNFGVLHLRVVNPFEPSFREARSAVGPASEILANAVQFDSVGEAIGDCQLVVGTTAIQHRELQHPVWRLDEAAARIRQQPSGAQVAILFGSEKTGLSNEDLSHCHWLIHIPTRSEHLSMNLGQAVAVVLYELARESDPLAVPEHEPPASAAELDRLTTILLEALQVSEYCNTAALAATEEKVRRMICRMALNSRDAEVLLGMLRQTLWKLRNPGTR
jgi:TrmH family RNA methyltransferase